MSFNKYLFCFYSFWKSASHTPMFLPWFSLLTDALIPNVSMDHSATSVLNLFLLGGPSHKYSGHFPLRPYTSGKWGGHGLGVCSPRECVAQQLTFTLSCNSALVSSSSHKSSGRELKSACHWETKSCFWSGRLRKCWKLVLSGIKRMSWHLHVMPANCSIWTWGASLTKSHTRKQAQCAGLLAGSSGLIWWSLHRTVLLVPSMVLRMKACPVKWKSMQIIISKWKSE